MALYKKCVYEVLAKKGVVFMTGVLSASAVKHKLALASLFLSDVASSLQHECLMLMVFNGDWRETSHIPFYTGQVDGMPHTPHEVLSLMKVVITTVALTSPPSTWPRHRWTGAEKPVKKRGLLQSLHGVFHDAMQLFFQAHSKSMLRSALVLAEVPGGLAPERLAEDAGRDAAPLLEGAELDGPAMAVDQQQPQADALGLAHGTHAQDNERHRSESAAWLVGDPLPMLMVLRQVMESIRRMLHKQFHYSSLVYKQKIQSSYASVDNASAHPTKPLPYPIVIVAELQLEKELLVSLQDLFESDRWDILPQAARSTQMRHLIFKLLSRVGGLVHKLHEQPKSKYPTKLFKLVESPQLAASMERDVDCLKDEYTQSLEKTFGGFQSEAFKKTLIHHASLTSLDIANVETLHASIRRQMTSRSCQIHTLSLGQASCEWVFQCHRSSQCHASSPSSTKKKVHDGRG